jgi:DNA-binding MarR family transcriptional regulator
MIDPTTQQLLTILHAGGTCGYWWYASEARDETNTALEKITTWWPIVKPTRLPSDRGPHGYRHIYFGVHPTIGIPQERRTSKGEVYRPRPSKCRPVIEEIAAINCLFAEFDAKRFDGGKAEALAHIEALDTPPSAVIDSGGGYHTYTLLDTPYLLADEAARAYARRLQYGWVALVGSDADAKDLSRVLRVPGTYNYKEAYGPNYPQVTWVRHDLSRRYTIADLEAVTRPFLTDGRESKPTDTSREPLSEYERVEEALSRTSADRWTGYQDWIDMGMALHSWDSGHNGLSLWDRFSRSKAPEKWASGICESKWATFKPNSITIASVFHWAESDSPRISVDTARRNGTEQQATNTHRVTQDQAESWSPPNPHEDTELPLLLPAHDLGLIPPAEPLVTNLIYTKKIHQFFGPAGSGKSFLALDIGATISLHYPVLYIAAEAIEDYPERIDAWEAHYHQRVGQLFFWRRPLTLASEQDVQRFIAAAQTIGPVIVFIDPLADCMTGLNENDPRDMSIAVYALNTIRRRLGAAVVVIHHTGWSTDHERGHSTLRAACRVVAKVEAREDGLIRLTCEKKNHGRKFDPRSFRLVGAGTMGGVVPLPARLVIPGKLRLEEKLLRIMEALTTEPLRKGATHTALLQDTTIPAATLNRSLTSLSEAGYIRGEDNGRSRLYYLTEAGRDALDIAFEERSESWNASGRDLEEGGRTWNWEVASSAVSAHQEAVLPNTSISSSTPGISLPPTGGDIPGGTGPESSSTGEDEARVRGFRVLEMPEADDAPLFDDEPEAAPVSVATPTTPELNWTHLRQRFAAQDIAGIKIHCAVRQADYSAVMAQLEAEETV